MKLTILLALFSSSAFAASDPAFFAGNWSGKGTYILNGKITQCSEFNMEFNGSGDQFEFTSGNRKCDDHEEEFYTVPMEVRDGKLYFADEEVGTLEGDTVTSWFRAPEGDGRFRIWRMSMRRRGDHLMYEESRTMEGETTPMISFSGLMILKKAAR